MNAKHHDGYGDGLVPLQALELSCCNDFDELLAAMEKTALGARQLGEVADVLFEMIRDEHCFVVASLSGVMTVAKMGLLLADMIELGMVHAVISTGALMGHGLIEATGLRHFKWDERMDDTALYEAGYDRVFDTLELEQNFGSTRRFIFEMLDSLSGEEVISSHMFLRTVGAHLSKHAPGRGILKSAFEHDVPVFVPAFTDSEMGMNIALYNAGRRRSGLRQIQFNPYLDFEAYVDLVRSQHTIGLFTIGGGVPRNWAQQAAPYTEMMRAQFGDTGKPQRFAYAVRICPEPAYWGGASGAPYSEGISWGKVIPKEEGGKWAEVLADATIAWPIVLKGVIQRLQKHGHRFRKERGTR